MDRKLLSEMFKGHFENSYDGQQGDERARAEFMQLSNFHISWTQVHGDFKDLAKRVTFVPYPDWPQLYECCGLAIRAAIAEDKTTFYSDHQCARIMGAAMQILKTKYGKATPKWWYPVMLELRGVKDRKDSKPAWRPGI